MENTLNSVVHPKLKSFGPAKCSIYLRLPWKGQRNADMVENSMKKAVTPAFPACEVKVVYTSKPAFQGSMKDNMRWPILKERSCTYSCAGVKPGMWGKRHNVLKTG